jgi:hypothetical protein
MEFYKNNIIICWGIAGRKMLAVKFIGARHILPFALCTKIK